jgi:hypothetical protein
MLFIGYRGQRHLGQGFRYTNDGFQLSNMQCITSSVSCRLSTPSPCDALYLMVIGMEDRTCVSRSDSFTSLRMATKWLLSFWAASGVNRGAHFLLHTKEGLVTLRFAVVDIGLHLFQIDITHSGILNLSVHVHV